MTNIKYKIISFVNGSELVKLEQFNNSLSLNKSTGFLIFTPDMPAAVLLNINLYLIRHGETFQNERDRKYGFLGAIDEPINQLNENGTSQAKNSALEMYKVIQNRTDDLKETIPDILKNIGIVTSKRTRTVDTATPFIRLIKEKTGVSLPYTQEKLANEISFGDSENKYIKDLSHDERAGIVNYTKSMVNTRPKNGESYLDLMLRAQELLQILNSRYKGKTVILFGHGAHFGAIRILCGDTSIISDDGLNIKWRDKITPNATPYHLNPMIYR